MVDTDELIPSYKKRHEEGEIWEEATSETSKAP